MAKCKTCGKRISVPKGWSIGPAVRRHYWAKHPEMIQGNQRLDKNHDRYGAFEGKDSVESTVS